MRHNSSLGLYPSVTARAQAVLRLLQHTSVKKAFKNDDLRLKVMLGAMYHVVYRVQAACRSGHRCQLANVIQPTWTPCISTTHFILAII